MTECESLRDVHNEFVDGFSSVDGVVDSYFSWLKWIFYVICYRFNLTSGDYEYVFFRGLKRGDERYSFLTCLKFDRLARFGRDLSYFGLGSHGRVEGSGLHVVLEYDSNLISLSDAWLSVGSDFNRFITRVRRLDKGRFGRISVVRVFEAHESGFPHIHLLLIFRDYVFSGYSSRRRGRVVYRVSGVDRLSIKRCWVHGFSDVELVDSFSGGIRYLSKYLVKNTSAESAGVKGIRGLAMCWVFRKRSFSMSGALFLDDKMSVANRGVTDEILHKSNSNSVDVELIKVGVDLYGNSIFHRVERWRLFGFCKSECVLWDDWCSHRVLGMCLKLVGSDDFVSNRSYYDLLD